MDLSKMPVRDEDLKVVAGFPELRKLILNFTDVTGATLADLKKLGKLRELSLSGTTVKIEQVKALESIPSLKKVYLWSTGLKADELTKLQKGSRIVFEAGFRGDLVVLSLNPPVIVTENQLVAADGTVALKHQIAGTVIRYTMDGTEPDSITSLIYKKPFPITRGTFVKARAFKTGWFGSKQVEKVFFKSGYRIDSAVLLTPVDARYKAEGAVSLFDGKVGDADLTSRNWLGYNENNFQSYLHFKKTVTAGNVTLSMLRNLGGSIFPPTSIEIWGGMDEKSVKLSKVIKPEIPAKHVSGGQNMVYDVTFEPQQLKCIKVVANPLTQLPTWHNDKGKKGWLFLGEILVN